MLFEFKTEVAKHWSSKNNNRIRLAGKRIFCGKQEALLSDRQRLVLELKQAWAFKPPIMDPLHAEIKFYFKDFFTQKGAMNLKLGDLDNLLCLPLDAMQLAGIIENDAQFMSFDGSRKLPGDANILQITLRKFDK